MTADWAVSHLYHFCAVLPPRPYVDLRPAFSFLNQPDTGLIIGEVTLPNCLISSVRHAQGRNAWRTEQAAMKDAAFQAYMALYKAGLLNDNLLPLTPERASEEEIQNEAPSSVDISGQFNPWADTAKLWSTSDLHQTLVHIEQDGGHRDKVSMLLTTSMAIPSLKPLLLYWDSKTTFTIHVGVAQRHSAVCPAQLRLMREVTHTILRSTHSDYKPDDRKDFVALFCPDVDQGELVTWLSKNGGRHSAEDEFHLHRDRSGRGFVRNTSLGGIPFIFNRWRLTSSAGVEEVEVECLPLLKRRNFLHRATLSTRPIDTSDQGKESSSVARVFPMKTSTVDLLPFEQARLGLFIPAILQHVELLMVASVLCKTVLREVRFRDPYHPIEAICASSAHWVTNYQRYEFLGDSLLKFVVSSHLFLCHVNWHEGYLSRSRASLVSNHRLARAALDVGLDQFIITEAYKWRGWVPPFISELETSTSTQRQISGKTLADVVEALIAAAFMDGGLLAAKICIQTFLPEVRTHAKSFKSINDRCPVDYATNSEIKRKAESLIDYQFHNKHLLIEALTHPSCEADALTESYQRLEFLGDAVLDMVVVLALVESKPDLSHGDMTAIKAALVNANLLGFLCMEVSLEQDAVIIQQMSNGTFSEVHRKDRIELWEVMRHHSQDITRAQRLCKERHKQLGHDVRRSLKQGRYHPWAQLAQLNPEKYYSDLVESIFGAIFVDSEGSLANCQRFAERIGLSPYLRRLVAEHVDVAHPRTTLDHIKGSDKVEYIIQHEEDDLGLYRCQVRIGNDADAITVGKCLSKEEAVTRAADAAVKKIRDTC
jgi:dsRNA-specific ribonuclease